MDRKQFENEKRYAAAAAIARRLFESGLITRKEFEKLKLILADKCHSVTSSLNVGAIHTSPEMSSKRKEDKKAEGS